MNFSAKPHMLKQELNYDVEITENEQKFNIVVQHLNIASEF